MRKNLMYTGLCVGLFALIGYQAAQAQVVSTQTITVNVVVPQPDLAVTPISWGNAFFAVPGTGASATLTAAATPVYSQVSGTPGGARMYRTDATGATPLLMDIGLVTPGVPGATMSYRIRDVTDTNAFIMLDNNAGADTPFRIDTWTAGAATPANGTFTFTAATASGTVTLSGTGQAQVRFGATLRTQPVGSGPYVDGGVYEGDVLVTISY